MDIYPSINQILHIMSNHKYHWHKIIKRDYPEFAKHLTTLRGTTMREQTYNYCYPGTYVCDTCGSDNVGFLEFTTGYRKYCSRRCTAESEACKLGTQAFFADEKRVASRRANTKETCMDRYGGPSPMSDPDKAAVARQKNAAAMARLFPSEINGRTRKQYTAAARHQTNLVYKKHKDLIDPDGLRSFDFVLDHVFSISDGFKHNVPIDVISHYTNLELVARVVNSTKHAKSGKTLEQLYEDYQRTPSLNV